ncbi:hypothetical protein AEYBE204_19395 [Asticcacaulis sp. YBE204]|nr:hypothetical protein AEYBE204_19395 [Asticcacaulis sp. YBE204]
MASSEAVVQGDWLRDHILPHDAHYYALARRLSASYEDADAICQTALCRTTEGDQWRRISDPPAYMMRLIFDLAVAGMEARLPPASAYVADTDQLPDAPVEILPPSADVTLAALSRLPTEAQQLLSAWRIEGLSCDALGHRFGLSPDAVTKAIARSLTALRNARYRAFCDPVQVCEWTDAFFGGVSQGQGGAR